MEPALQLEDYFASYPSQFDPLFQVLFAKKLEFFELASSRQLGIRAPGQVYYPHQELLARFFREYNYAFNISEAGTGKTRSFIAPAEYFREQHQALGDAANIKRTLVILTNTRLIAEAKKEILRSSPYYADLYNKPKALNKRLDEWYDFWTIQKFADSMYDTKEQLISVENVKKLYSNTFIYVDEIQRVRRESEATGRGEVGRAVEIILGRQSERKQGSQMLDKIYRALEHLFLHADNIKVMNASATPAYASPTELNRLGNLILQRIDKVDQPHGTLNPLTGNLEPRTMDLNKEYSVPELQWRFNGLTTYVAQLDTGASLYETGNILLQMDSTDAVNVSILPSIAEQASTVDQRLLFGVEMTEGDLQWAIYQKYSQTGMQSVARLNTRLASLMVFPDGEIGGSLDDKKRADEHKGLSRYVQPELQGDRIKGGAYRSTPALNEWIPPYQSDDEIPFKLSRLRPYSAIYYELIPLIKRHRENSVGTMFIFSHFLNEGGLIFLGKLLEHVLGYESYRGSDSPFSLAGKQRSIVCTPCGDEEEQFSERKTPVLSFIPPPMPSPGPTVFIPGVTGFAGSPPSVFSTQPQTPASQFATQPLSSQLSLSQFVSQPPLSSAGDVKGFRQVPLSSVEPTPFTLQSSSLTGSERAEILSGVTLNVKVNPRRYSILSGDSSLRFDRTLQLMNAEENWNGDYLHIVLGAPASGVGISLSHVTAVYALTADPNEAGTYQFVNRALRSSSHDVIKKRTGKSEIKVDLKYFAAVAPGYLSSTPSSSFRIPAPSPLSQQQIFSPSSQSFRVPAASPFSPSSQQQSFRTPTTQQPSSVVVDTYMRSMPVGRRIMRSIQALRSVAFDAHVNARRNTRGSATSTSRAQTGGDIIIPLYTKMDEKEKGTDVSTYQTYYADKEMKLVQDQMLRLTRAYGSFDLEQVVTALPTVPHVVLERGIAKVLDEGLETLDGVLALSRVCEEGSTYYAQRQNCVTGDLNSLNYTNSFYTQRDRELTKYIDEEIKKSHASLINTLSMSTVEYIRLNYKLLTVAEIVEIVEDGITKIVTGLPINTLQAWLINKYAIYIHDIRFPSRPTRRLIAHRIYYTQLMQTKKGEGTKISSFKPKLENRMYDTERVRGPDGKERIVGEWRRVGTGLDREIKSGIVSDLNKQLGFFTPERTGYPFILTEIGDTYRYARVEKSSKGGLVLKGNKILESPSFTENELFDLVYVLNIEPGTGSFPMCQDWESFKEKKGVLSPSDIQVMQNTFWPNVYRSTRITTDAKKTIWDDMTQRNNYRSLIIYHCMIQPPIVLRADNTVSLIISVMMSRCLLLERRTDFIIPPSSLCSLK